MEFAKGEFNNPQLCVCITCVVAREAFKDGNMRGVSQDTVRQSFYKCRATLPVCLQSCWAQSSVQQPVCFQA